MKSDEINGVRWGHMYLIQSDESDGVRWSDIRRFAARGDFYARLLEAQNIFI